MTTSTTGFAPNRLRSAAFAPIGDEGRVELVEVRLVQAISTGAFTEGERLPSENELARHLGVSVDTVREALGLLRGEGLIETRRGRHGGSFVRTTAGAVEAFNTRSLMEMSRLALADLGVQYEIISAGCAEYASRRATTEDLDVVERILQDALDLPRTAWRQRITAAQLELAALSQSVRLTADHVRLQTEFTPLLALQDADIRQRQVTHEQVLAQLDATRRGDIARVTAVVREGIRGSVRWLIAYRSELIARGSEAHSQDPFSIRNGD
ncbi:FadR/GntR family transcriptional regulator [Streptomyces sp. AC495_CC817]|uniref:FadR/GntR family transcriptional regulator n=1 Tax=Streptomyces sp. AC495_CC817 TaxID=2823900 RepID=UPI001C2560AA|nr:GntR family transcriptional regulator [Streptomyces sp. AC495_CC817]